MSLSSQVPRVLVELVVYFFKIYKETVFCGFLVTVVIGWRIYLDHKEKYLFKEGRFGFCTLKEPEEIL